ncbi:hypothetical protein L7F22_020294 [Adiantum nelumboides]|nr:hypothetical protein [Adiantum nelumboides]
MPIDTDNIHAGLGFAQYMLAGSVAGMVEHTVMFPVDALKTRMQMEEVHVDVYTLQLRKLSLQLSGQRGWWVFIGALTPWQWVQAPHMRYTSLCMSYASKDVVGMRHVLAHATAGIVATIASDAVFTPMDVVKQRLQLHGKSYKGVVDCIQSIMRRERLKAFYASYRTTVVMNAPYTATHFATYEAVKTSLKEIWPERSNEENFFMHLRILECLCQVPFPSLTGLNLSRNPLHSHFITNPSAVLLAPSLFQLDLSWCGLSAN